MLRRLLIHETIRHSVTLRPAVDFRRESHVIAERDSFADGAPSVRHDTAVQTLSAKQP